MPPLELTPLSEVVPVPSGRATLAVEAAGDGPAVVCLHAGVADRRSWRPLAPWLVDDHQLIAPDRRGYGDTTYEQEPHDELDDLLAVLDALDVPSAVLVGNSQGGRVALEAALAHPDRVDGLVLLGAAWTGAEHPADPPGVAHLERLIADAEELGNLPEVNRLEALLWLDGPDGPEGRVAGSARELFLDMNWRALTSADVGEPADHGPVWPHLPSITVPATVAEGTRDHASSRTIAEQAATALPDAKFVLIEDVAHLPTLEAPERVATIIRELVARTR